MPKTLSRPKTKTLPKPPAKADVLGNYGTMYFVQDMPQAAAFFKAKLGLKPRYESQEWTEFDLGGGALCLHAAAPGKSAGNGTLILRVSKIRDLVAKLRASGVRVVSDVREIHPGAYGAEISDPDGNVVSLYDGPSGC